MSKTGPAPRPIAERFWSKVSKAAPDECWLWTAGLNNMGYGQIGVGSRSDGTRTRLFAHRVSYELHNGPIPPGMDICHKCDTPACVNPSHLFAGTRKDNMADCKAKGRTRKPKVTHCKYGHPYDEENTGWNAGKRVCRACMRQAKQKHRAKNIDRERARCRAYYHAHKTLKNEAAP